MPLLWTFAPKHNRSYQFDWPALWLGLVLMTSCPIRAETLVNAGEASEPTESVADSGLVVGAGLDGPIRALSPETMRRSTPAGDMLGPQAGKVLKEIGKQTIDQPGHFLVGAAPIWASRYLVGVPWYGWAVAPLLAYREWLQWPSNRWWDPPLDWAFLSLGAVVATCRRRSTRRLLDGLAALRRRIARDCRCAWRGDDAGPRPRPRSTCARYSSQAPLPQCSSKSRMPAMTSRIPITSVRLGHS